MKIAFVDIQGFTVEGIFHPKELSIEIGFKQYHFLFTSAIPYNNLDEMDRKTVRYLERNVHGIQYTSGFVDHGQVNKILESNLLYSANYVYVRGNQKAEFLQRKCHELGHYPVIIDVSQYDDTNQATPKFERTQDHCANHDNGRFNCTQENVGILRCWFLNTILPK
ncbi:unnamed protein product [Psylliodes chrysocephalus]|uniref:Uncharacterized protein n=1 Tax=Psylliodes chrysocephalus TaxID=3402493 RepID=A0A9P0CNR5_9CUCU|nr:unnamed protein product [Psylliodes chrysocephala]